MVPWVGHQMKKLIRYSFKIMRPNTVLVYNIIIPSSLPLRNPYRYKAMDSRPLLMVHIKIPKIGQSLAELVSRTLSSSIKETREAKKIGID